MFVVFHNFS